MSPFLGPSGSVTPGIREPFGGIPSRPGFNPLTPFNPRDIIDCYPMPPWVAQRLRDYPQTPVGNALLDPLPVPFTAEEVTRALNDVWQGSHQPVDRYCAHVDAASVQIALQVLPILQGRNGGWIDFSPYQPSAHLECLLYKLVGKPLADVLYNPCRFLRSSRRAAYKIRDVQTTFDPSVLTAPVQSSPVMPTGGYPPIYGRPAAPSVGFLGHELEAAPEPEPDPFSYNLFTIVETFDIKES